MQKHISGAFDTELEELKTTFTELGGLAERQVTDAIQAFFTNDSELAASVKNTELQINRYAMELDKRAEYVIARRQPAATDLRLLVSILKSSTDLERVGDESERIAKFADRLSVYDANRPYHDVLDELHTGVTIALRESLDSFARLDVEQALQTIASDREIDSLYDAVVKHATEGNETGNKTRHECTCGVVGKQDRWSALEITQRISARLSCTWCTGK